MNHWKKHALSYYNDFKSLLLQLGGSRPFSNGKYTRFQYDHTNPESCHRVSSKQNRRHGENMNEVVSRLTSHTVHVITHHAPMVLCYSAVHVRIK